MGLRFLTVKLLDYRDKISDLERSPNPFAPVVLAHLQALATGQAPAARWESKVRLVKRLYDRGLSPEQVRQLFRLIDWMLALPAELEQSFREELHRFEEERRMPYVTSVERLAREEGHTKGLQEGIAVAQEGIALALEAKFGHSAARLVRKVRALHDLESLRALAQALKEGKTLEDLRGLLR